MIKIFILKDYEYSMLLDCYHNPKKVSQDYFVGRAKMQRGYYNASHIFATTENEKIYTHSYKVPSVWGAKRGYATVRKILRLARTHYFMAYERKIFYNDFFKKCIEINTLNIREPHNLDKGNHAIIILNKNIISDLDCNAIAREIGERKYLKQKHIDYCVCKAFNVIQ